MLLLISFPSIIGMPPKVQWPSQTSVTFDQFLNYKPVPWLQLFAGDSKETHDLLSVSYGTLGIGGGGKKSMRRTWDRGGEANCQISALIHTSEQPPPLGTSLLAFVERLVSLQRKNALALNMYIFGLK